MPSASDKTGFVGFLNYSAFGSSKIPEKEKKLEKYKPPLVHLYTIPHDASFTSRAIWYIRGSVLIENNRLFWRRDGRLSKLVQRWINH
jgi:hypothetical protein